MMKKNIKWSFQPAQWLSSADEGRSAAESYTLIHFHRDLRTPVMSSVSSQVGVTLFPSF